MSPDPEADKHGSSVPDKDGRKPVTNQTNPSVQVNTEQMDQIPPASFFSLFQFSTRTEIFLDIIGLVAAALVGSAQPLLSLIFGRLANSFVSFGEASRAIMAGNPTPEQQGAFDHARAHFRHESARNALYLVVIGIGAFVLSYLYMVIWNWTGERNSRRIRERYLQAILRQEIAYFDNLGAGEIATRIQTDTHLIHQGISEKVALVTQYTSSFITGYVIGYARSWRLALAMTSIIPCIGVASALMGKYESKFEILGSQHISNGASFAEEVISTVRTAKAFGTQQIFASKYDAHMTQVYRLNLKAAVFRAGGLAFFFFAIFSSYGLAFSFGTTLLLQGHGDIGAVVNVLMAIIYGSLSIAYLAPEMQALNTARGAAAKIFATIDRVPEIDSDSTEGCRPETVAGAISVEDVHFAYPSRPDVPVLKGISLTFAPGTTSALVGASGSGKSTIVSLVERFYDPSLGCVKLDGVDLKDLNVNWLRAQIGLVSQEPVLFALSIRENVAYGLVGTPWEYASDDEKFKLIKTACVKANADAFISKLTDGYDTRVGERGFLLSGGQKQRIAIARAIVSDPAILVLDEATSALDTQSEGIVQDALNKASHGRTTITVAHRLSTIKEAHRIYVMGDGALIEAGTHDELLRNPEGAYAQLVGAQKLRESRSETQVLTQVEESGAISQGMIDNSAKDEPPTKEELIELDELQAGTGDDSRSLASEALSRMRHTRQGQEPTYGGFYLFKRMVKINREVARLYGIGALAAMVAGMTFPVLAIVYGNTIQGFQMTNRQDLRYNGDAGALHFFIIAIVAGLSVWTQNIMFQTAASALIRKLRNLCFTSILRQDVAWFDEDRHSTGALVSSLSGSPQQVFGLAGITLGSIVASACTLIGGSIVGLVYCWKLTLVSMCSMPFLFSMGYTRLRVVDMKDERNKKEHEESARIACEVAGAIKTVASLTRQAAFCKEYSDSLEGPLRRSLRTSLWSSALFAMTQSVLFLGTALSFWYGSRLVSNLEFSTKDFFTCLLSVTFGAMQAGHAFNFVPDVSSAKGAATDMIRLIDSRPDIDSEAMGGRTVIEAKGRLQVQDVHFRYASRPAVRVLRGLNVTAEPGSYVAIVGPSGSGKSTVIQLLERFYDPQSGRVLLDGQEIPELNVQSYRSQMALVSQEPTLYSGSVKFNILLGATKPVGEVTQDAIEQACRDANILDFVTSLPDGFETEVGGKGSQLSGGQKQRIAIARALLRDPKVLLLDEATSALDSTSEKVVQQALDIAARGRTTISIAHRLSTIQNADRIYYIKDGRVAEAGTHDELLRLRGGYYELVQLQALSSGKDVI